MIAMIAAAALGLATVVGPSADAAVPEIRCTFTYEVHPELVPRYGAEISEAMRLFQGAGVLFVPTTGPADLDLLPMNGYPPEWGGALVGGDVLLRVQFDASRDPGRTLRQARNIRTSLVIHEIEHFLGMTHADGMPEVLNWKKPVVTYSEYFRLCL